MSVFLGHNLNGKGSLSGPQSLFQIRQLPPPGVDMGDQRQMYSP